MIEFTKFMTFGKKLAHYKLHKATKLMILLTLVR